MAEITPMMKQYLEIKEQNKDSILFFRLGDFYEMFNEDAQLASRELDLTLTTRDRGKAAEAQTPMSGIHYHSRDDYIARLRALTGKPIFRAFKVKSEADLPAIENCAADHVLRDSGAGTGKTFDWSLVQSVQRPYFLAGGLDHDNVADAIAALHPYGVDVSSGIETGGVKDESKMAAFVAAARKEG